jgi:zinc/manganese transport system substrate-binding protein
MRPFVVVAVVALIGLAPGRPTSARAETPIPVVASFSVLADMVRAVGGDRAEVTELVGADQDGHTYQPTPSDVRRVARAKLLVVNGFAYEGWMLRLTKSSGFKGRTVTATQGVKPLQTAAKGANQGDRHGHGKSGHRLDPHAWQDLGNAAIYVDNIVAGLSAVDPGGADGYRSRGTAYKRELADLDLWVRRELGEIPDAKRRVITTHDAFGYFARAYGVEFMAPVGVSTDAEPTAADVARLVRQIRDTGIKAIFVENLNDPRLMDELAREAGVKVGGTLYSDALSKPGGPAASYLAMIRHNASVLKAAMLRN